MSLYSIVVPETCQNQVLNPSAEATGNFAAEGAATVTRDTTYAWRGVYSYKVVSTAAANDGVGLSLQTLANAAHYVTLWVRGTLPATWVWSLDNSNWNAPTLLNTEGSWWQYGCAFPANQANGSTALHLRQTSAASVTYYADAVQSEAADHWTTYCDGDEPGCLWSGTRHASYSTRSAQRREGGRVRDMTDYYGLWVEAVTGLGEPPIVNISTPKTFLDGATYQRTRAAERTIQLVLFTPGTTLANYHALRAAFLADISPDKTTPQQPFLLRYSGAGRTVQIPVLLDAGAEDNARQGFGETMPLRLLALDDPYWAELREASYSASSSSTATLYYAAGLVSGAWSALGLSAMGGTPVVRAIVSDGKGNLYVGGDFTSVNGNGNMAYIAKYNVAAGAWSALGSGMAGGGVYALCLDAAGNLYAGGAFTGAGGVGSTGKIAKWNGSAWSSITSGGACNSTVYALCIGTVDGWLYAGGAFTAIGGIAISYLAVYDWSAWSSPCTVDPNGVVWAICPGRGYTLPRVRETVFFAGAFTTAGGISPTRIARLTYAEAISSFSVALLNTGDTGLNGTCYALVRDAQNNLYGGGAFTTAGGVTTNYVAKWNGNVWAALGAGLNASCLALHWSTALNGLLVGGNLTTAGAIAIEDAAFWDGYIWQRYSLDFPGSCTVTAVCADLLGNQFFGFNTTGSTTFAYDLTAATLNNPGSAPGWPIVEIKRSGGNGATLTELANVTTGKRLLFDNYALANGETVTIDLRHNHKTAVSDAPPTYALNLVNKVIGSSDLGTWCLQPGGNQLRLNVTPDTAPTITLNLRWAIKHRGADGGAS